MKKVVSFLLTSCLLVSLLCGAALAAEDNYSVTFYTDAHTETSIMTYIDQLGDFTMPDAPTLKGYEFSAWTDGTNTYQPGDVIQVQRNLEFHALWTQTHPFTDVDKNDAYFEDVMYVYEQGLMTGTNAEGTIFSPDGTITRATIWTVLGRMAGADVDGGSPWYAKAQAWAVQTGVSDGTAPNRDIPRQELAAMLYRQAGSPAVDLTQGGWSAYLTSYQVASWAGNAMVWALQTGVIEGDNMAPAELVSRAELAGMLVRFSQLDG